MNRQQRRAAARSASKTGPGSDRSSHIVGALDYLATAAGADTTVSGATVILPDGEVLHLDAATALAMARGPGPGPAGAA